MAASSRTIQELLTVTPAPKKITSTLIRNLRPGIDYRMSSHSLAQVHQIYPEISSYVSFQFDINIKEKITFFDPLSCTYKIQGEDDKTFFFSINRCEPWIAEG